MCTRGFRFIIRLCPRRAHGARRAIAFPHYYHWTGRPPQRDIYALSVVLGIFIGASVSEPHLVPWEFNAPAVCLSVCLYIYIYISYVRHFWSRGPRATRKRKPAHLKFKGHMHACCILLYVANASRAITNTYRASTHVQQLSDNQQRRLEAETTHEREERLQQLSAAQVRS